MLLTKGVDAVSGAEASLQECMGRENPQTQGVTTIYPKGITLQLIFKAF